MSDSPKRVVVAVLAFNEREKLKRLLQRFPESPDYDLVFVDDGSTDGTGDFLDAQGYGVINHGENLGVGAGIRSVVDWAKPQGYEFVVIMAANGKMLPEEIPRLTQPLLAGEADYIQGSRNLEGGESPNLPLFRRVMIKLFTLFVNLAIGVRGTDITCGFRAYRLDIMDHPQVDITQEWLGRYEMEYYIHYKVVKLGYRLKEVPVSMVYPEEGKNYSKIKPFTGWWSMIRPWVFLILRIKR